MIASQLKPMGERVQSMASQFGQGYMSGPQQMRMQESTTSPYNLANALANAPTPLGVGDDLLKALPLVAGVAGKGDDIIKGAKALLGKADDIKPSQVSGVQKTKWQDFYKGDRHITEFENADLTVPELQKKIIAFQEEGGMDDLVKGIQKEIQRRSPQPQGVGKDLTLYRAGEPNLKKGTFATDSLKNAKEYGELGQHKDIHQLDISYPQPDKVFSANSQFDAYVKLAPDTPKAQFIKHRFLGGREELLKKIEVARKEYDANPPSSYWGSEYADLKDEYNYLEDLTDKMQSRHKLFVDDGNYNFVATLDRQIKSELQKKGYQLVEYVKPSENKFRTVQRAKEYVILDPSIIKNKVAKK